jgi:protease I
MNALLLTADGFEDMEVFYPLYRLQEAGWTVQVATPNSNVVTGKHGYSIKGDLSLDALPEEDYDLLILPGGKGPETVRLHESALAVTRHMMRLSRPVAAICHGPQILLSAGVLEGRRVTAWQGIRDDMTAGGAEYVDRDVVVDGSLVTSRRPEDLPAFCREIFEVMDQSTMRAAVESQA